LIRQSGTELWCLLVPAIRERAGGSRRLPRILCVKTKFVEGRRDKREVDDRLGMCKEKRRMGGFYVMLMSAEVGGSADRRCRLGRLGLATDK
jgi:hypothetical protein